MNAILDRPLPHPGIATGVALSLASLLGAAMPFYVGLMGDSPAKLVALPALPALLVCGFLLLYDRKVLLLLVILLRSTGDVLLESTRFSIGGYQVGVGGLINAFVILVALLLALEKPAAISMKAVRGWMPFLLVALAGVAMAPEKAEALRSWLSLLSYFAMFASAFHFVRAPADFKYCVSIVLWSSVLPAAYGVIDFALHGGGGAAGGAGGDGFRLQSTFGHANAFAFYLTLVISLGFYLLKNASANLRTGTRGILALYLLLLVVLLILTKTRSAWIACFLSLALYAVCFERRYLLYLALLPLLALFVPGVAERLSDLGQGNEVVQYARLNSFAWRVYLWQSALDWVRPANYLLGHGLQSFKVWSPVFFPLAGGINWGAHSVYVQWLFELGMVGFFAYLWVHCSVLRQLASMWRFDRGSAFFMVVIVINYLVFAFSDNMNEILSFNWYFWFILGAACAVVVRSSQAQSGEPHD